jgi:hypothetical protein
MKGKREKLLCTWPDTHCCFNLVQLLGWLGSGWQPSSKTGEVGEPRRAAAPTKSGCLPTARGGRGRVLEHEEAMGDRFEMEMEPTGAHRALEVGVDRLERRWRALGVRSANTVVLGRWSWKRQRGRTRTEVGCPRACTRRGGRHQLIPWRCLVADSLMPGHRLGRQGRRLAGGCSGGMRGSRR